MLALVLGPAEKPLREIHELKQLAALPVVGIEAGPPVRQRSRRGRQFPGRAEAPHKCLQGGVGTGLPLRVHHESQAVGQPQFVEHRPGPLRLRLDTGRGRAF